MSKLASRGLIQKFLLVFVPAFVLLASVGFWQLLEFDSRTARAELTARIGNQAARASMALSRHGALTFAPLARDLLAPLTVDRAVACTSLQRTGADGLPGAISIGLECSQPETGHAITLPINDGSGTELVVQFSDAEILAQHEMRRNLLLSVLFFAFVSAVLSATLGFRLVVQRRLDTLNQALRQISLGGERVAINPGTADELGQIISSFNAMIESETRRENDLQTSLEAQYTTRLELERLNGELKSWIRTGESERRFKDFAAAASDWYWEMDEQLRFSYFSDRFSEITGVPKDALLGKTRRETGIPNVDQQSWDDHLEALDLRRAFRNFEHPRKMADGTTVWLAISGTPVFDASKNFIGYRGTGSDITERVKSKELLRQKSVSEQLARTKSEFLANMSHEIRTPINGVPGMTEILLKTDLDEQQRRFANTVCRSAEALLRVINEILDFSKIEAGKMSLQTAAFDIQELIEDVAELFAETAHSKNLELATYIPVDMPTGYLGDSGRLRQVVTNLVGNALKFTADGEVVVRVSRAEDIDEHSILRVEVQDTGIGISEDAQSRIFDSFAQADGSTERKYGGSGLGLAISAQLVELMGGEIGVHSAPGQGSTFWFKVRLGHAGMSKKGPDDGRSLLGVRVLAVDDNRTNREILTEQLHSWGMEYDCSVDAESALELMHLAARQGRPYELAVLDRHMPGPGMDGIDLSRAIRGESTFNNPHLVMLSSVGDPLSPDEPNAAIVDSYLSKPVRRNELYTCLARAVGKEQPAGSELNAGRPGTVAATPKIHGHILLAEDNLVNQEVAMAFLAALGLTVDIVCNGSAALDAWIGGGYDLILMDCQMPEMNGFEATRMIRNLERQGQRQSTPIVALTANAMEGDRKGCLDAGMDDYLSKPFTEDGLRETLARWLPTEQIPVTKTTTPNDDKPRQPGDDFAQSNDAADVDSNNVIAGRGLNRSPLDRAVLERFRKRDRQGSGNFLSRIVSAYLEQSPSLVERMHDAAIDRNLNAARDAAHTLKSSSAQIGAMGLSELCESMEADCRAGHAPDLEAQATEIAALYERVSHALTSECAVAA